MAAKVFKFKPFSKKQKKILTWWMPGSPYRDHSGIIADGSIRAGKTVAMAISFVMWSMEEFEGHNFAMCGKTIGSYKRNVLVPLKLMLRGRGYKIKKEPQIDINCYSIHKNGKVNYYYMFGGKDESSQDLIQGITLAGLLLDEVAIMVESFVEQAMGRLSIEGSKVWFNCNPKGPKHWFKTNYIDRAKKRGFLHLHFTMDDNLTLSKKKKAYYHSQYEGLFFMRYILGLWAFADGVIYSMFNEDLHTYKDKDCPINWDRPFTRYYAIDYGTVNPFVCLEIIRQGFHIYIEDEFYYDSKKKQKQKDDSQYVDDVLKFIGDKQYSRIIIDPSAASYKIAGAKKGLRFFNANNDVADGIRLVASLITLGLIQINKDKCKNIINEFFSYIWDAKAAERGVEEPIKQFDHALDALRYFCKTIIKVLPKLRR